MAKKSGNIIKRGDVYYGRKMLNGKRITKSLGTKNIAEAKKKYKEIFAPIVDSNSVEEIAAASVAAKKGIKRDIIKIQDLWTRYEKAQNRPDSADSTLKWYSSICMNFIKWLSTKHPTFVKAENINDDIAQEYANFLRDSGYSNRTFNAYIKAMSTIYTTLFTSASNPFRREVITRKNVEDFESHLPFTIDEIHKILASFDNEEVISLLSYPNEMQVLFYIGAYTGLRQVDAATLRWDEINFDSKMIRRIPRKTERTSKAMAIIPFIGPIENMLKHALQWKVDGFVLPNIADMYNNKTDVLNDEIKAVLETNDYVCNVAPTEEQNRKRAIVKYSFHSFRSSFACIMAPQVNITILAKMLADSVRTLEKYYIDIQEESIRKAFGEFQLAEEVIKKETDEPVNNKDEEIITLLEKMPSDDKERFLEMLKNSAK